MSPKKDQTIAAVEAVHTALKDLDADERQRVLASVRELLNISASVGGNRQPEAAEGASSSSPAGPSAPARALSIRELIEDKKPRTSTQLITLFAYYREKHENHPSFARDDLKRYYTASRENPPANFDRDFVEAIRKGWIHEDAENSYITSKGIEAVVSGFAGTDENKARKQGGKRKKARKAVSKKRPRK